MPFGKFSGISASIALALMMLPMVAKATEESLKMIPYTLKEASYALGANYYTTIKKVVLPSCQKGITSGVLIGISRILGETAPLLFTAFGNAFLNFNMTKPINALPLLIYNYASSPYQEWHQIAWASSLFLIIIVLGLSIIAKNVIRVIIKLTTNVPKANNFDLKLNLDHHEFIFSTILKSSNNISSLDVEKISCLFEFELFINN